MNNRGPRSLFLAIFVVAIFQFSGHTAWPGNQPSTAELEQGQALEIVDCPSNLDTGAEPAHVVLQIINDVLHKWEEYDLGPNRVCLVLIKPEERLLSALEAGNLLRQSEKWIEQAPSGQAQEILSPQDPQLTLPPAMAPVPSGSRSESDGPDTEAGPPPLEADTFSSTISPLTGGTYTLETVIGNDDRARVISTTQNPWWVIGYQSQTFPNNVSYRCTGFLVGPQMALTNGHCIYNSSKGGYAKSVSLAPAQTQASAGASVVRPYGTREACHWRTNKQYVATADYPNDYAAMFFKDSFSASGITTYMPLVFDFTPGSINTAGYPVVVQGQNTKGMWRSFSDNVGVEGRLLTHTIDTSSGQSGSPLWHYSAPNTRRVVAIHAYSGSSRNGGPRWVDQNRAVIENWMANQADYCGNVSNVSNAIVPPMQMLLLNK